MGFYGNITNTSRTQFQFDRIYQTRTQMDLACGSDGVYPGRYVLIEYGSTEEHFNSIYLYNGIPYASLPSVDFIPEETNEIIRIYTEPDLATKYKVVSDKYESQNESDLFIRANEIIMVPSKRRVFNVNQNERYIGAVNFITNDYMNQDVDNFEANTNHLLDFLIQYHIVVDDEDYIEKGWDSARDLYFVNGKLFQKEAEKIRLLKDTGYPIQELVWRIPPKSEYYTNEYNQYFKIRVDETQKNGEEYLNPVFDVITGTGNSDYVNNFNIDRETYDTNRGYDSTVWQKTFVEGVEKYVMVAELNTVVPTFDIVNDAPTIIPLTPHFDGNSTNVYYRLHWQPSWAIRTKAASPYLKGQRISQKGVFEEGASVTMSSDEMIYPSDQFTSWGGQFYNTLTNKIEYKTYSPYTSKWQTVDNTELAGTYQIPAAIYYNKAGFNKNFISESGFLVEKDNPLVDGALKEAGWNPDENKIGFFPTGRSGHMYNNHDDSLEGAAQVDTQEFICMLPSLGNAVSSMWDLVYGGRETNKTIAETLERNLDIAWESNKDVPNRRGLRLRGLDDGYNVAEVNTVAGALNSMHDLMGMIITSSKYYKTIEDLEDDIVNLSTDRLYYTSQEKEYYRKQLQYDYEDITQEEYTEIKQNAYKPVEDLKNFLDILKPVKEDGTRGDYADVFYQEYNDRAETDVSRCNYIQESTYHPNRLYFQLKNVERYVGLQSYKPSTYFYTTDETGPMLLDVSAEASQDRVYFELENYLENGNRINFAKYNQFKKIPSNYNVTIEANGDVIKEDDVIHGIYKPNSYYYAVKEAATDEAGNPIQKIKRFILDTSKTPTEASGIYYTINKDKIIEPDENSYRLEINYEPIFNVTKDNYVKQLYYYLPKGFDDFSIEDVKNAVFSDDQDPMKIANESTYDDVVALARSFTEAGNTVVLFKKHESFIPNEEKAYAIEKKPIFLKAFEDQAIFQPVFDDIINGQVTKFLFINEDNIPRTVWKDLPDENGVLTPQLVLMDDATERIYSHDLPDLYILGLHKKSYAESLNLISLGDIKNKTVTDSHVRKCYGTFYESNLYHYHPSNKEMKPLPKSYLLDTTESGLRDEDGGFIDYYKIDPEDISLVPNTFEVITPPAIPSYSSQAYAGKNYYYAVKEGDETLYKPVINKPAKGTKLYKVKPATDFYEPNKYYVKDAGNPNLEPSSDDHFTLARGDEMPTGPVYRKEAIYVTKDENGVYPYGTEWNLDCETIPPGVTLAKRTEYYGVTKVPKLARTDNTMHGVILRINQMLEAGNTGIRDISTVQGALNVLNDIIARFDKMKSGQFVIVDEYGRMHSANYSTAQAFTTTNEQTTRNTETNAIASTEDRWISLEVDPTYSKPTFTVQHNFTKVNDTKTKSNKNGTQTLAADEKNGNNHNTNDTLELYTPIVDNTGHVVGKNTETVTLPYGFKSVSLDQAEDTDRAQLSTNTATVIAKNTKDELTLAAANKWIRTAGTDSSNTIQIAHEIHTPVTTTKTATDLNNGTNTITLQDITYDEAGHIIGDQPHTYTLPYGYKHYKTAGAVNTADTDIYTQITNVASGANTSETIGVAESKTQASNTQDELTVIPVNKWIQTKFEEDALKIAHEIHAINTEAQSSDLNNSGSFIVQDLEFDAAGHVIKNQARTYTLPYNFKTFAISNSTAVTQPTAAAANIIADTQVDTMNLNSSNRWLVLNANANTDTLTIGHAYAGDDTGRLYGDAEAQTPKFGATFQVPYFGVDEAGHIKTKSAHTVTIPQPSLTNNGTGNVVTGLSLNAETGAFVETKANVGTLPITDFNPDIAASVLQVTDSMNTALAKLQSRIANNEKTITDLDVNDTAVAGQYVSSVTQTDGKITVNRVSLTEALNNTYAPLEGSINTSSEFSYEIGAATEANKTIEWLFKKVADLEAEIEALKSV